LSGTQLVPGVDSFLFRDESALSLHLILETMSQSRPGMTVGELFAAWGSILNGRAPMLSIEITRECPLSCPGCYAYGESHLGGERKLTELSDLRGDALVSGVLALVERHRPRHVSLVGGEPMIRHRELSRVVKGTFLCASPSTQNPALIGHVNG